MTPHGHCPVHRCPLREPMEAVCTIGGCRLCAFEDLPSPNDWCGPAARFWQRPEVMTDEDGAPDGFAIFDSEAFYADRDARLTARDTWEPAVANDTANSPASSASLPGAGTGYCRTAAERSLVVATLYAQILERNATWENLGKQREPVARP